MSSPGQCSQGSATSTPYLQHRGRYAGLLLLGLFMVLADTCSGFYTRHPDPGAVCLVLGAISFCWGALGLLAALDDHQSQS